MAAPARGLKLIERGIPAKPITLRRLLRLLGAVLGFLELLAQLLHLLLRHRGLGLLLLGPRFLVAQLVPLLKKGLLAGFYGPLVRLVLLG